MYFLQGLTLGLAYVAPIGVQNMFVIDTGLTQPCMKAYQTALIVIFFDISLALACFFGIGALMDTLQFLKMAVLLIGSLIVMIMGIKLFTSKDSADKSSDVDIPILKVISMACVVTWFNPQAIIDGSLLLGAFRVALPLGSSTAFIAGVATASCIWFLSIAVLTSLFRSKFSTKILRGINIVCGVIIFAYGIKLGWSFIQMLL